MDEEEIIQNHLLGRAGEHSHVILGLGYDNTLGSSLGITLIATGFEHKDPFPIRNEEAAAPKKEEKILMPLNLPVEATPGDMRPVLPSVEIAKEAPNMKEPIPIKEQETTPVLLSAIQPDSTPFLSVEEEKPVVKPVSEDRSTRIEWVLSTEREPVPQ